MMQTLYRRILRTLVKHWPIVLPLAVFVMVVRAWFTPGLIAGEDFGAFGWSDINFLRSGLPWPHAWDTTYGFGQSTQLWMNMFPLLMPAAILARLGVGWAVLERIFFLYPLVVLVVLCPYIFAYRLLNSRWAAAVSALVFSVNTWTIGLIERGHLPSIIAYSLIPLAALIGIRAAVRPGIRLGITLSMVFLAQVLFDVRYALIGFLVSGALWLLGVLQNYGAASLRSHARFWLSYALSSIVFNLYWILPTVLSPASLARSESGFSTYLALSGKEDFLHGFAAFFPFYHHVVYNDAFYTYPVEWPFVAWAVAVIAGFCLGWKHKVVRNIALLWCISVLVVSGPNSIVGSINRWAFLHVPGMDLFRDNTKLLSVVNFADAFGIAVLLKDAPAFLRRAMPHRWLPGTTTLAIVASILYITSMSDAFNPLRFSNFAVSRAQSGDEHLKILLASERTPGRVLYFPQLPPELTPTSQHPALEASHVAQSYSPEGLAEFNPDPGNILRFFNSPLAPALLCQGGVRYVAIVPDPFSVFYAPFTRELTRGDAIAYFRAADWLQEIPMQGAADDHAGEYVLFRLRNCAHFEDPFVAPYPLAFNGTAESMSALVGTKLWSEHPAVLLAEQQSPADFLKAQNVVNGVPFLSTDEDLSYGARRSELHASLEQISRIALHVSKPFVGYDLDQASANQILGNDLHSFVYSAGRAMPARASVRLRLRPRQDALGTLELIDFSNVLPQTISSSQTAAELVDPKAFSVTSAYPGNQMLPLGRPGGQWVAAGASGAVFDIINPLSVPAYVDIDVPGIVALQGSGVQVTLSVGDTRTDAWASPRFLLDALNYAPAVTLRHLLLSPGATILRVAPIAPAPSPTGQETSIAVNAVIELRNITPLNQLVVWHDLPARLSQSQDGAKISLSERYQSALSGRARYRLLDGFFVPLAERPSLSLRFIAPREPYSFRLAFGLTRNGKRIEFKMTLPQSASLWSADVQPAVQRALNDQRDVLLASKALDTRFLVKELSKPRDDASTYSLHYIDLEVVKTGNSVAADGSGFVKILALRLPKTAVAAPLIKTAYEVNFTQRRALERLRAVNLKLERVDRRRDRLQVNFSVPATPQFTVPRTPVPGDSVSLQLTNGTVISGTVVSAQPNFITVRQNTALIGVQTGSIATITQLAPNTRGTLSFVVPVRRAKDAQQLSFLLSSSPLLTQKISLLVRDRANGRVRAVFPQDRLLVQSREQSVPDQWVTNVIDPAEVVPIPNGIPWFQNERTLPSMAFQRYALDLPSIFASEIPGVRSPEVVGLLFEFSLAGNIALGAPALADISLADVELRSWTQTWRRGEAPEAPQLLLDGEPLRYRIDRSPAQSHTLFASSASSLKAGTHVFSSQYGSQSEISSAMLGIGTPVGSPFARMTAVRSLSYSEIEGRISTGGGLLVFPQTYSKGWSAALLPDSVAPSGHLVADFLRLRSYFLNGHDHVIVNDIFNGWYVPHFTGRIVFIFLPTVYSIFGALAELVIILAVAAVLLRRRSA